MIQKHQCLFKTSSNFYIICISTYRTRGLIQGSKEWVGPLIGNETVRDGGVINSVA